MQPRDVRAGILALQSAPHEVKSGQPSQNGERGILEDASHHDKTFPLPVLGSQAHPGTHAVVGMADRGAPSVDDHRAAVTGELAEDYLRQFGAAGSNEPREPHDLAGADLEAHIPMPVAVEVLD